MNFIKHISYSLILATGTGARQQRQQRQLGKLMWIAVCGGLALVGAGLAQFNHRCAHAAVKATSLKGEAAIRRLKSDGGYASLAGAMAMARYQINAAPAHPAQTGGPFYANNPGQQLRATFTSDEVRLSSALDNTSGKKDGAELRLGLAGYGYGDELEPLTSGTLTTEGNRIAIAKSAITEWYVNKPEGLEQGFTLAAPPAGERQGEWLRVALSIGEGWSVSLRGDGQGAVFERQADGLRLGYDHLMATDALGRTLPARMAPGKAVADGVLLLLVDDAQAAYPLTIDPIITQQQKQTAADGAAGDQFGAAIAISGDTAVIGAPLDDVFGVDQGSAYIFVRNGTSWSQQQKIITNSGLAGDHFGAAVAISGDTVVVGAPNHDNGPGRVDQGSGYVFVRSGTVWTGQVTLIAFDGAAGDQYGFSVAISGDTVVVGAPNHGIGANANQGAAYVATRNGTAWSGQQTLIASDGAASDFFGTAVSLNGDNVVVGVFRDTIGANADQGSAYVFTRSGRVWTQQQKLTASDGAAGDNFGFSVALSGDTVVVGALSDNIGANASQGSAYVFTRSFISNGAVWTQQQKLIASDGASGDQFGVSVALSGDTLVVGVSNDAIGANTAQGSAYVFSRSGAAWTLQKKLTASDGAALDGFGASIALGGDIIVVGALGDDIGANNNQGSAYVFFISANNHVQQQRLIANDGAANDGLGVSVALSGDTVVVGAPSDDVGTSADQGSAYVFIRSGTVWTQQQKLTANDGAAGDFFGFSVALSADTLVIGAFGDSIGANAAQGSAYVFSRNAGGWTQKQKLTSNDGAASDAFGFSVALSADTLVIGAFGDAIGANQFQGSAYIFNRNGPDWKQQQKIIANDGAAFDEFGSSIALSGDTLVVGVPNDIIGANVRQGSAYVFTRSGGVWALQQKLITTDNTAVIGLGFSVAISGDTVVVGVVDDGTFTPGSQGAAYVFTRSGTAWTQQQKLIANDGGVHNFFSTSVAINGDIVVVGAFFDGVGGNAEQGSTYVFTRSGTSWTRQQRLTASDGAAGDSFGTAVALSGDTIVVGTNTDAIGANQRQGSAYVFVCPACPTVTLNPANLPGGVIGTAYSQTVTASSAGDGTGPFQFSLSDGALPPGLTLTQNGLLSGLPTTAGTYSFTITATILSSLCPGSRNYTLTVIPLCPTVTLNPSTLPAGQVGLAYTQQLSGSGGTAPYSFVLVENFTGLPAGLTLTPDGLLSGPPTAIGSFNFTVKATDANGCQGTRAYNVTVTGVVANNGLQFYPLLRPVRILDTRAGQGNCDNISAPITGGSSLTTFARLTCEGISIPDNAQAVVGNLTIINQTNQNGFLTIYPDGQNVPLAASMIYGPNGILANNFTVGLSANGNFNIFGEKTIDAIVDISGYYAPPGAGGLYYHPLSKPVRLLDTRPGQGNCDNVGTPINAGSTLTTLARKTCEGLTIPQAAQAIVGVATVINGSGQVGFLTLYPNGVAAPLAANLVYFPGEILSNAFTVSLSASGEFNIFGEKTIDLVVDVSGYYSTEANDVNGAGLLFTPLATPVRLLDTRAGQGNCDNVNAPIGAGTNLTELARMTCEGQIIPNNAQTVNGNVTVINQTNQSGFLTLYPTGQAVPVAANMIYEPGQILSNAFVVGLSGTGQFNLFAERTLDAIVDVSGFFTP